MQLAFQHGTYRGTPPGFTAQRLLQAQAAARRTLALGQAPPTSSAGTIASFAAAGASATVGIMGTLSALAAGTSVAGPIGLAATAVISIGLLIAKQFQGCGQTCIQATAIANQVEPYLVQNRDAYLAAPVHYASLQAAHLNNFDTAWQSLLQACGQGTLGATTAGKNCVSDRQEGSCAYHTTPGGWEQDTAGNWSYVVPGPNNSGSACWNWFVGYRDVIANDPTVVPDPVPTPASVAASASGAVSGAVSSLSAASGIPVPLLLILGAGLLLYVVVD
jgi:hypothetical protein